MDTTLVLVALIIAVALAFDFINGFHDAANSVATIVATRVLSPFRAVAWAAFWNFIAAFAFETGVASTVGKGMVDLKFVTPYVILAGLVGAIVWDLITWYYGLPTSSSHALLGGYGGAAMAKVAMTVGVAHSFDALIISGWSKTIAFIVISPLLGMLLAYGMMIAIFWICRRASPARMDRWFCTLQLLSSAIFSFAHGTNDAQKTMGIITGVLVTAGYLNSFVVPVPIIFAAHIAIGLGTLCGGWRIIKTMGGRLTRLRPRGGFSAETAAAMSILFATYLKMPVSTTHVIAGAIVGVGSIQRLKAVRWGLATNIVWAWVMTIPASALVGAAVMVLIRVLAGKD
ncbi:MAG: inorganic phosphate transporter [Acidobacteria bacterium]|jgi:PiT family inorganic phosphate transporter|nr:inorganic phosphate transporter [Acidobacteriota bacterium]